MKPVASRMRSAVRTHALNCVTAALAATAIVLFLVALARAAGAGQSEYVIEAHVQGPHAEGADRAVEIHVAERQIARRLSQVAGDFGHYIESLQRVFERDLERLETDVTELIDDYEAGAGRQEFGRRLKSLDVRLDLLAKRIDRLGTTMPVERAARPY